MAIVADTKRKVMAQGSGSELLETLGPQDSAKSIVRPDFFLGMLRWKIDKHVCASRAALPIASHSDGILSHLPDGKRSQLPLQALFDIQRAGAVARELAHDPNFSHGIRESATRLARRADRYLAAHGLPLTTQLCMHL